MRFFRRKPQFTDADAKVVGFFFAQYVELMKHGKDATDDAMKQYVYDIIQELGVPDQLTIEAMPIEIEAPKQEIIINRRNNGNGIENQQGKWTTSKRDRGLPNRP